MIADLVPDLGQIVIRWLAVFGGAALGALLTGLIVKVLARFVTLRKVPQTPLTILRLLGGVALGWIVYLLVFGPGGPGFGFGGSGGWGWGGPGPGAGGSTAPTVPTHGIGLTLSTQPTGPRLDPEQVLVVEMLGGDRYKGEVRDVMDKDRDPYYLVEKKELTYEQVRQQAEFHQDKLKVLEIVIRQKGSVGEGHQAVQELKKDLAPRYGLTVRVVKPAGS